MAAREGSGGFAGYCVATAVAFVALFVLAALGLRPESGVPAESDTETFLIATRQDGVSDGKLEVYSPNSQLGSALLDAKVGETRTYTVPNGNTVKVTLCAEPYHS